MNKKCKWESTCDDDCRRPYGNCPKDCKNYKPYVSVEELEKENGKLQGKIADLESEYYELENFKENEIAKLQEENRRLKNENKDLRSYCGQLSEIKKQILKIFDHVV